VKGREPENGSARAVVRGDRHVRPSPNALQAPGAPAGPVVVKIGGRSLDGSGAPSELAAEVASIAGPALLVHGGGGEVSEWCARLSIEPSFIEGLRVTDPETLEVAVAVLAGLANKRLVAVLREAGVNAVGLSALDGGIAEVALHPDAGRLGAVGRVDRVRPGLLELLIGQGRVPVLASIGACRGRLLNINADELAAPLSAGVKARALVLLSDTHGLRLGGDLVRRLTSAEVGAALASPDVQGGMLPKLRAAVQAIANGVASVHIGAWSGPGTLHRLLAGEAGTTIVPEEATVTRG